MKIPTPRTDEEVEIAKKFPATSHGLWVSAEFARQLEIELDGLRAMYRAAVAVAEEDAKSAPPEETRTLLNPMAAWPFPKTAVERDAARWRALKTDGLVDIRIDGQEFVGISNMDAWADARLPQSRSEPK